MSERRNCGASLRGPLSPQSSVLSPLIVAVALLATPAAHAQHIYWSDSDRIGRAGLDGSGPVALLQGVVQGSFGVAVDQADERLYWTDAVTQTVRRADLDGSDAEIIAAGMVPWGIALDLLRGRVYWTQLEQGLATGTLQRANLDGSGRVTLLPGLRSPKPVVVDVRGATIYWSELSSSQTSYIVRRADLDGGGEQVIISNRDDIWGLAVDALAGHLYWSESPNETGTDGRILRSRLDGSMITELVEGLDRPAGLALDLAAGRLFFADTDAESISRAPLSGSGSATQILGPTQLNNPVGIALAPALAILSSEPPDGAVDARQPSEPDGASPAGITSVDLVFNADAAGGSAGDFEIESTGGDAPTIDAVSVNFDRVTVVLDQAIPVGECTTIRHVASGDLVRIGFLPADVDGDGTSEAGDITVLIDHLNGILDPPLDSWQCDANRSGLCEPSDILRVIDLLNGAGAYRVWNGESLPECASGNGNENDNGNDNANDNANANANQNDNGNSNSNSNANTNGNDNLNSNGNDNDNGNTNDNSGGGADLVAGIETPAMIETGQEVTLVLDGRNIGSTAASEVSLSFVFEQFLEVMEPSGTLAEEATTRLTWIATDIEPGGMIAETVGVRLGTVPEGLASVEVVCIVSWIGADLNLDDNVAIRSIVVRLPEGGNDNSLPQARPPLPAEPADEGVCGACGAGAPAAAVFLLLCMAMIRARPRRK